MNETVAFSKLSIEFKRIQGDVIGAYVAVGMITEAKLDFFMRGVARAKSISIITGIHMPTPPEVLRKLKLKKDLEEIDARVYTARYFHSKLYLFNLGNSWIAFVGSGNFTNGGWYENEELFIRTTSPAVCQDLKERYDRWFADSNLLTDELISWYAETYDANNQIIAQSRRNSSRLADRLRNVFNIDNIDFSGQFFAREDHLAFQPGKTHLDTPEVLAERGAVRAKLYRLNDRITASLPAHWQVYPHYENAHIVANIETRFHHHGNVKGLWVGYGRDRETLKQYGETDTTPLHFMRMQVIIRYDSVGVWLMPGKAESGQIDRENFLAKMSNDKEYAGAFFVQLSQLGSDYWIEIAGDIRPVTDFGTAEELKAFSLRDAWRNYYFTIGRNYPLGSDALRQDSISQTVLQDFAKYQPIYEMIRDKSLENH